jgi:hypothetical protein
MPPGHSQVCRKLLKGQTWEVVANGLQLMQKEAKHKFVIPVMKVQKPVMSATSLYECNTKYKKKMINLQAWTATTNNTPKRNTNCPTTVYNNWQF